MAKIINKKELSSVSQDTSKFSEKYAIQIFSSDEIEVLELSSNELDFIEFPSDWIHATEREQKGFKP